MLRSRGHVLRKNSGDWVKGSMAYEVEGVMRRRKWLSQI